MTDTLLSVDNVSIYFKRQGGDLKVVNSIAFDVAKGEIFGVVGESGCGKSITAAAVMGILPQNAYYKGDIYFKGQRLSDLTVDQQRGLRGNKIAMIFQEPMTSLNPVLTVGYQIAEVLMVHKGLSKTHAIARAVELLGDVKIPSPALRVKDYPHQMSGGMRQRVMIAMAIACNPALVLADEPTTALDVTIQAQVLKLLRGIQERYNMSVVLITHDLGLVSENAGRVAIMYAGRIMESADTATLFKRPVHPYTIGLLNSIPKGRHTPLVPIPGFVPKPDNLPEGCKFSDRCGFAEKRCKEAEPMLLEIEKGHFNRCILTGKADT
ncbi:ABC transporter ATP-binding protein [Candidatus Magnetominusculus xianensis]|uniref:Peptide ABC transporter ATP-binding protein n=1 Tax=Candidatus Magnetominusculus xianensis TaxID=1748249 RepID=A0ABR5SDL6_9BACT|nr:ABC transporter ATP-binding protein [Candidatus Magnetominusculus xianensis]KWT83386.1 peptide ABC transporter ATP-binding protein [Candidatus Magnetominusculus xianensis]MBF0405592.1 ABC transporter ATP-binding protein [Nitrospirota bacterium]